MRIQLLGPLRAWRNGDELELGGPQQRVVLGLLATSAAAGNALSLGELVDALWGEYPPASGNNVVQTYLKRLRRVLEPERVPHGPSQFLRRVGSGQLHLSNIDLDLVAFRRLVDAAGEAERAGDQQRAARDLGEALRLWKGAPLANLAALGHHPTIVALAAERWATVARYGEAMLATHQADEALPTLEQAVAACPLDEAAHVRLIRAYQAVGNRGQAFATFQAVRERLAEELGIDPGAELAAAHLALLQTEPRPGVHPVPEPDHDAIAMTKPAQLPKATAAFVGRVDQLQELDKLLSSQPTANAVTIAALTGAAGIGKTTLAVHWAHQVADRFPDGQLFVNLRGFDPSGPAMSTAEALRSVLEALGLPPQRIPTDLPARTGLYRSLVAGRRMLVVLDNALDTDQVRPLLPGTASSLVLVTSRNQLTGLVAEAAQPINLDLLSADEARSLLARRLSSDRLAAQPHATDEIIQRCGGLPMALAIVAARAATNPQFRLTALAEELSDTAGQLDGFTTGEASADLRAVFSWSYHALDPGEARMFRLLPCHPGPDISVAAAASLAGVPVRQARQQLATLSRTHLLVAHSPDRYAFHDLLRAYASELAQSAEDAEDLPEAEQRLLDHLVQTGHRAALLLEPHRPPLTLAPPSPGVTIVDIFDRHQAQAWFALERLGMLSVVPIAARQGHHQHAWQLAWTLVAFLDQQGHWHQLAEVLHTGIGAAARVGDRHAQAAGHCNLVYAYGQLQRFHDAAAHAERALGLLAPDGDYARRALVHRANGWVMDRQHRYREGLDHELRSLELFRAADARSGEASALNAVGWKYAQLGDHRQAVAHCEQALAIFKELDDRYGQGLTWDSLGYAHLQLGDHQRAVGCFQTALDKLRDLGERYYEAICYEHLGDAHRAMSNLAGARTAWTVALALFNELDHPDADPVRTKLQDLAS